MQLPLLTRYADIVRYDRARGIAVAIDWRAYPARRDFVEYPSAEASARASAAAAAGSGLAAAYLAGYALALAARAWADRPAETCRAAIIQAGEWHRRARPFDRRVARVVDLRPKATVAGPQVRTDLRGVRVVRRQRSAQKADQDRARHEVGQKCEADDARDEEPTGGDQGSHAGQRHVLR